MPCRSRSRTSRHSRSSRGRFSRRRKSKPNFFMIKKTNPRILTIDSGTRHIGIAVLQGSDLVYHGVLTMPHRRSPAAIRRNTRALLRQLLSDFRPTVLAIEANSIGSSRAESRLHAVVSEAKRVGRREHLEVAARTASNVKKVVTGKDRKSTR